MALNVLFGLIHDMAFAAIPAVGFALVFNVPVKALKYCAIGGALGYGCRYILMHFGVPIEWATFCGASLIGAIGVYWSQRFMAHPKVFTVAGIIPMVPGSFAFKAMIAFVEINSLGFNEHLWATAVNNGIKAIFIIGALAIGLAMPRLLFNRTKSVI